MRRMSIPMSILKSARALLLVFFFFAFETQLVVSDTNPKLRVRVLVSSNVNMEATIESFINQYLRSLRDVEIAYKEPQWKISLIHLKLKTTDGNFTGHALSVATTMLPNSDTLHHMLYSTGKTGIRDQCLEIAADFDVSVLEPYRQAMKNLR